jgi:hypothetical protein
MKIEGYFSKIENAKNAVEKLKSLGLKNAFVDINEHYAENRNTQARLPGTMSGVSLSALVVPSAAPKIDRDMGPLTASSPMVSGIGDFEEVADVNCKIIVEVSEPDSKKAKEIIKNMGGELESPHFRKPKIENKDEIDLYNTFNDTQNFLNGKS